jgi:hypothetical protein
MLHGFTIVILECDLHNGSIIHHQGKPAGFIALSWRIG